MRLFYTLFFAALLFVSTFSSASASRFVWEDPASKFRVSFPDEWARGLNEEAEDVLTIYAPAVAGRNDFASCRVRIGKDARFKIHPRAADRDIEKFALGRGFWADTVGLYRAAQITNIYNGDLLGNGAAARAEYLFVTDNGPKVLKRGIAKASIYNGKLYMIECSADRLAFDRWEKSFLRVINSVKIRRENTPYVGSYYRHFTQG